MDLIAWSRLCLVICEEEVNRDAEGCDAATAVGVHKLAFEEAATSQRVLQPVELVVEGHMPVADQRLEREVHWEDFEG